jgi:hypothetical protein
MAQAEDVLALSRSEGAGLVEGVVTRNLVRQGMVCPTCRASFVVGGACLNPACPSHRGDDDYRGAPLVHIRDGLFVYAPDRPGWVEEKDGEVKGIVGDGLVQAVSPERVTVRQANDRTALLIARLASFTERELPTEAARPLPSPSLEAVAATRRVVQERAPFPSCFDGTLEDLTA